MTRDEMAVAAHEEAEMLTHLRGPGDTTLLSTHTVDRVILFLRAVDAALSRPAPPDDLVGKLRQRAQELALYAFREHGDDATLYNALADLGGVSPDGTGWLSTLDVGMTESLAAPAPVAAPDDLVAKLVAALQGFMDGECHCGDDGVISPCVQCVGRQALAIAAPAPVASPAPETPARKPFTMNVSREWLVNMAQHEAETLGAAPETPAPDAMPAIQVGDEVVVDAMDITVVNEMHRDWLAADPSDAARILRVKRNGVVIWRRQEAQP